ncbi:putative PB1 domain-containing protein [Helianthus anomalus]
MDEASLNLGSLSREILQQDSGETQIVHETNTQDQQDFSNNYPKNKSSVIINTEIICVDDATSKILDVVTREKQACTKRRRLGVSRSTLKKKRVVNVSDTRMVTVKASFKDDIIKFDFPISSGVSELKNQVAQRIKLKSTRLRLKYRDEDGDLILISCDADIRNLMPLSASSVCKKTIRLIVQMTDD